MVLNDSFNHLFKNNKREAKVVFIYEQGDDRNDKKDLEDLGHRYRPDNFDVVLLQTSLIKKNGQIYMHGKNNLSLWFTRDDINRTELVIQRNTFKESCKIGVETRWEFSFG